MKFRQNCQYKHDKIVNYTEKIIANVAYINYFSYLCIVFFKTTFYTWKSRAINRMHEEEDAAKHLLALEADIDSQHMEKPSFLMILTGGQYAYRREDGVYVVPIGCLKD